MCLAQLLIGPIDDELVTVRDTSSHSTCFIDSLARHTSTLPVSDSVLDPKGRRRRAPTDHTRGCALRSAHRLRRTRHCSSPTACNSITHYSLGHATETLFTQAQVWDPIHHPRYPESFRRTVASLLLLATATSIPKTLWLDILVGWCESLCVLRPSCPMCLYVTVFAAIELHSSRLVHSGGLRSGATPNAPQGVGAYLHRPDGPRNRFQR